MIPPCSPRKVSANPVPRAVRSLMLCKWSLLQSSLYELQTSQRDTLSLIAAFMSGKNRTSQTLFLHFSTPKWELRIMFAMSHLRLCGTRIQPSLCRVPSLVAVLSGLGWKLYGLFFNGHPLKISSKI